MNSEIKYPAILRSTIQGNQVVTVFKDGSAIHMEGEFLGQITKGYSTDCAKNITHEYLSNTWGVVESKEHAEFIIELAELHGFKLWMPSDGITRASHFIVCDRELMIHTHDCKRIIENYNLKQITIPLPPKPEGSANELTPEEEFELHQNQAVQALNNTATDAEARPSLGDRVTTYGQQGDVILPADKNGFYIINADGLYLAAKAADIAKPKSKQDLLIEELQTKLCENNYVDNYTLANDIVNGMIEGLRYEPK